MERKLSDFPFDIGVTYEQEEGPPPLSVGEYAPAALAAFRELLDSDPLEGDVQAFMEKNPAFVHCAAVDPKAHWRFQGIVVTQPPLPGFKSPVPDFLIVRCHSANYFPTLIEIERPGKELFTKARVPTADFTQARNQLTQWETHLSTNANLQLFLDEYGISSLAPALPSIVKRVLVFGRRADFENDKHLSHQRSFLLGNPNEELASFDRFFDLLPRAALFESDAITVKAKGDGRFEAVQVAPTFGWDPQGARRLTYIDNIEEAIDANELLSEERKDFLKKRVPYWRSWADSGSAVIGASFLE